MRAAPGLSRPYTRLARVLVRGKDEQKTKDAARAAAEVLKAEIEGSKLSLLGPSPAPIAMLEGRHRRHLLVKAPDAEQLAALFEGPAGAAIAKLKGVETIVDIDPQSML